MTPYSGIAALAVAISRSFHGGVAQYDSCINGTVTDIGNGRCDAALNVPSCGFDGGDCCPCTCFDGPSYSCSDSDIDCIYPGCDDPPVTSEGTSCIYNFYVGDGRCDAGNNHIGCSWDGGDVSVSLQTVRLIFCTSTVHCICTVHRAAQNILGSPADWVLCFVVST